jgi:CRISPR-associated endoribonuclease Cas6
MLLSVKVPIMPISVVIYLIPPEDVTLRPTMGHHAHAVLLSLLRIGNPEKAEEAHATSRQKPFTVSPLIGDGERRGDFLRIRAGTECWLRYTFLDDALFAHFGNAFLTQGLPSIRLGGATFQLSRMVASGTETNDWSGTKSYEELIDAARTDTRLRVRFHSPTAFRELSPRGEKTRNQAHIDLVRCYQSWVNKWNAFAPMQIDKQSLLDFVARHAGLTAVESRSRMLDFGKHKAIGFVGSCTYRFFMEGQPNNKEEFEMLRLVNLLADFAFYCGTGYKTTMGMGQTRRILED